MLWSLIRQVFVHWQRQLILTPSTRLFRIILFLPLNAEILIQPGQTTVGNQTIIARLQPNE